MDRIFHAAALLLASAVVPGYEPVDALNATIATDGVEVRRDIIYGPGVRGGLDIYRPEHVQGLLPMVVFFYGGAWKSGRKQDYSFVAAPLAREGVLVVVADYRLVPEVLFPAFVHDSARAVAFALAHAVEWGADPRLVFLMGHSAGGYNALMLALDPHYLAAFGVDRASIAGVVGIAAPTDFLPLDDPDAIAAFGQAPDKALTQPVHFIDGRNPPLLLLHGETDDIVYLRNSIAMSARVQAVGGEVTLRTYAGIGHIGVITSFAPLFAGRAPVVHDLLEFIRDHRAL
jgi:acetyl esterase/lipase